VILPGKILITGKNKITANFVGKKLFFSIRHTSWSIPHPTIIDERAGSLPSNVVSTSCRCFLSPIDHRTESFMMAMSVKPTHEHELSRPIKRAVVKIIGQAYSRHTNKSIPHRGNGGFGLCSLAEISSQPHPHFKATRLYQVKSIKLSKQKSNQLKERKEMPY
jgi:hypothetical protein